MSTYRRLSVRNNISLDETFFPEGEAPDLTQGYKAFMQVRYEGSLHSAVLDLDSEGKGGIVLGENGTVRVQASVEQMLKVRPDDYVYDIIVETPEGATEMKYYGPFVVRAGVTRRDLK